MILVSSAVKSSKRICPARHIQRLHKKSTLSSAPTTSKKEEKCPFHQQMQMRFDVPKLPIIGSLLPQFSGVDKFDPKSTYDFWKNNHKRFGDFYKIGMPTIGDLHVLTDPKEMHKVLRKESSLPHGTISFDWPFFYALKSHDAPLADFWKRDENWLRQRRFFQSDLLSPEAAKGYVPGMIGAAKIASKGAPFHNKNIKEYMTYVTFDLFSTVMFGELTGVSGPPDNSSSESLLKNKEFCETTSEATDRVVPLVFGPLNKILLDYFGYKPKLFKEFEKDTFRSREIAIQKFRAFQEKKAKGLLSDNEKVSYASRAIDRQAEAGSEVSLEEVEDMVVLALEASIDTTSAILNWIVIHLAMNPEVQEKLYAEISTIRSENKTTEENNGELIHELLSKSSAPYLHAVIRENHRVTPAVVFNLQKDNASDDVEIHGQTYPKGTMFMLDTRSLGMDPEILGGDDAPPADPDAFQPERWLKESVQKRKGTKSEVLDHPLNREPFSAGSRKCPGYRVANYEVLVYLSQLVSDWKISFLNENDQENIKTWRDIEYFNGLTVQPKVPELKFEARCAS